MNKAFEKFNTKKLVEDGAKIYLYDNEGNLTDNWIRVVNEDSKIFKLAKAEYDRLVANGKVERTPENWAKYVLAKCIIEWGGPTLDNVKFILENVQELLDLAPNIATQVMDLLFSPFFFKLAQASSSNGASDSSDSASATTKE